MQPTIHTLFATLRPQVPAGLAQRIQGTILEEEKKHQRFHQTVAGGGLALSFISFLFVFSLVRETLIGSEFWQLLSLLASDTSLLMDFSEAFLLSLAETFPAASMTLILAPVCVFFVSMSLWKESRFREHAAAPYRFAL